MVDRMMRLVRLVRTCKVIVWCRRHRPAAVHDVCGLGLVKRDDVNTDHFISLTTPASCTRHASAHCPAPDALHDSLVLCRRVDAWNNGVFTAVAPPYHQQKHPQHHQHEQRQGWIQELQLVGAKPFVLSFLPFSFLSSPSFVAVSLSTFLSAPPCTPLSLPFLPSPPFFAVSDLRALKLYHQVQRNWAEPLLLLSELKILSDLIYGDIMSCV